MPELKPCPLDIPRVFYHRTTEERWQVIKKEGCLWGVPRGHEGWEKANAKKVDGGYRYTYLAPYDWGDSYGNVLLEVKYDPKREDFGKKHNYGFDPPHGQICVQFSVFEPIPLSDVKRILEQTNNGGIKMKGETVSLKDILKPPFSHDHCGVGDVHCGVRQAQYDSSRLLQIRGWGFFQNFENGEQLQDEFKDFVIEALNEKWERDYAGN